MPIAQAMSSFWNTPSSIRRKVFSQCGVQSGVARSAGISMRCVHDSVSGPDRVERDQAQVVGMEDRDHVREDHLARRGQLAQRRHVGGQVPRLRLLRPCLAARRATSDWMCGPKRVARGQPVGEERIDRLLVQDADVIRLEEGVDDQLPVGRVLGADRCGSGAARRCRRTAARRRGRRRSAATSIVASGVGTTQSRPWRSSRRQGDEALGARVAGVERFGMQPMAQRAFEPVGPAVVRADDARLRRAPAAPASTRRMPRCRQTLRKARKRPSASRVSSIGTPYSSWARTWPAGSSLGMADDQRQRPEQPLDLASRGPRR